MQHYCVCACLDMLARQIDLTKIDEISKDPNMGWVSTGILWIWCTPVNLVHPILLTLQNLSTVIGGP